MAYLAGKQAFLRILQQEGVSVMFGNPGTTELPLMDGLAREPGIRYVLALQEAVAISMADAYAQASGGLGAVNVHVSPGLGNAMGMLDDAYKAGVAGRTLRDLQQRIVPDPEAAHPRLKGFSAADDPYVWHGSRSAAHRFRGNGGCPGRSRRARRQGE
jgi:hypothetical protein